jgi:hypothetical protein
MQLHQRTIKSSTLQKGNPYLSTSLIKESSSSKVKQTESSETLNFGTQQSASSNSIAKQTNNSKSVTKQSKNAAQLKQSSSVLAQKLVGEWKWYSNSPDGTWVYLIRFNADGTCNFEYHIKVFENGNMITANARGSYEKYSGTYQALGDNTISFKGTYINHGQPKDFVNSARNCEAKFKIEWITRDNNGVNIFEDYPDANQGMKLNFIRGTSPLVLSNHVVNSPYFVRLE